MKNVFLILFLLGFISTGFGQDSLESILSEEDSVVYADEDDYSDEDSEEDTIAYHYGDQDDDVDYTAVPDSAQIAPRSFDQSRLDELRNDPTLQYKEPPTIAESLWDRFLAWIGQLIDSFFQGAINTNWGQVLTWVLGLGLLIFLIMMLLKVDALKIFYSGRGEQKLPYNVIDENIHEMDFEALIQQAVDQKDYRRGTRLVFLYALKMLSDAHHISWEQGKTNHDYVAELKAIELKSGFSELSYYFEYAWYGNFSINRETFGKVEGVFSEWRSKVK